jgi:hypothetical protein
LAEGKKGFGLHPVLCRSSCQSTFGERQKGREGGREGGKEGGREEEKSLLTNFATVIQIQTLDKHIHPIMLRLFVDYRHFFPSFHSAT